MSGKWDENITWRENEDYAPPMPRSVAFVFLCAPVPLLIILANSIYLNQALEGGILLGLVLGSLPVFVYTIIFVIVFRQLASGKVSYWPPFGSLIGFAYIIAVIVGAVILSSLDYDDIAYASMGVFFILGDIAAYIEIRRGNWKRHSNNE